MSGEVAPPPTYSFDGDTSARNSPSPSEDLVSAQSHSSCIPLDLEACAGEQQLPDGGEAAAAMIQRPRTPPSIPVPPPPPPSQYYPYPLPFPQRRPVSSTPVAPEARISAFPDHKFEPTPLLRLPSTRAIVSSASGSGSSASGSSGGGLNSPGAAMQHPQKQLNPTNYVSVFRKTHRRNTFSLSRLNGHAGASIKGAFAVNPFLDIPAQLLAPLAAGETTRKNLLLKVENGGIDVDVHLIGEPTTSAVPIARTELHLELCGGADNSFPLIAKIHTPTLRRPPFRATLVSKNGFTSLHLPPSFHGLLTIYINTGNLNAHIGLSAALGAHATILSEDSTSRAYFIGALGMGKWEGDRAEVRVERGRVRVQFSGGGERDLDGLRRVGWEWMGV
ncbi:hypothetical protein C8R46DRAFT_382352 [Mycena filopes]|nr:hypothetical protein C8R46DRAFT_382352 [Mycena filopes]